MPRRVTAFARLAAINILILAALLIAVEGGVSWFLFARDVVVLPWVAEPYTRYDPDLGWVNKPNVDLRNMFGTGAWVRTNGQSFRNAADVAPKVAPGRYRVVCSGDSFTFGDGVDNDHTWCQQLAARDPRIEPVNLGEGGYGADQAYLRYLRDARDLEHQAHVFAFIADDFARMEQPTFLGFGKPVLAIENGELVARNVPVPSLASKFPWLIAIPRALGDMRVGLLVARAQKKLAASRPAPLEPQARQDERTRAIIRLMLARLKRVDDERGARLILLYQPVQYDVNTARPNAWMQFVEETARTLQIPIVNMLDDMRAMSDRQALFLQIGTAAGHYSDAGHALAADAVFARLRDQLPAK